MAALLRLTRGGGEPLSIIDCLWETNDNLLQLLSPKYQFAEAIEKENGKYKTEKLTYKNIEELNVTPEVKRQTWQTLQIVTELCKVMQGPPSRVFIELAQGKPEDKTVQLRRKQLLSLYKGCKTEERLVGELDSMEEQALRSDRLYLYYTQKGRCMYTGDVIKLEFLWDNSMYDIDHIYPQSDVIDDSIDNRVLVKRLYNAGKADSYPVNDSIRRKMQPFWKSLLDDKLISEEKYKRLVRATELEDSELAEFIECQMADTRRSAKAIDAILKQALPDTEIVYVKAKTVAQFRQDFALLKVRGMNDLHHAKDAYLSIVIGNSYFVKFTKNTLEYVREHSRQSYNLRRMFTSEYDIKRENETAWRAGENGTINTVRTVTDKNNIIVTRRSYQVKGQLFDQQLMKKGKGQIPVKGSDSRLRNIEKYGGYNRAAGTYFMLVESGGRDGGRIRTIEYVPLYLRDQIEMSEENAVIYLQEGGLSEPKILLPKIKIDTLFKVDGFSMWLSGRTGNRLLFKGANQLILSDGDAAILKKVMKFRARQQADKNIKIADKDELPSKDLIRLYDVFLDKIQNTVYHLRLEAPGKTLADGREHFFALCGEDKCVVLSEILHLFQCQSTAADLSIIGGPKHAGILVMNNDITKCSRISIINQSPTGIYEQEIDLKRI